MKQKQIDRWSLFRNPIEVSGGHVGVTLRRFQNLHLEIVRVFVGEWFGECHVVNFIHWGLSVFDLTLILGRTVKQTNASVHND